MIGNCFSSAGTKGINIAPGPEPNPPLRRLSCCRKYDGRALRWRDRNAVRCGELNPPRLKEKSRSEHVVLKPDGSPYKSIRSAFKTACKHAKLAGVIPHTLRHAFASRLTMVGVDLRTIQELGDWRELQMLQRYAHLSPSRMAKAVERIANHFPTLFATPDQSPSDVSGLESRINGTSHPSSVGRATDS